MARIRSFAAPHKGLRSILGKFSFRLGFTTWTDPDQVDSLKELGQELFTLLKDHVHTENEHTLLLLDERAPGASEHDRQDHQRLEQLQQTLEAQLGNLTGNETPDDMHAFYLTFSQFQGQYLAHIFEEETVTELALQQHFTDDELIENRILVMKRFELSILLLWLKYIVPAGREEENVAMLSGLKANVPNEVMEQVLTTIQNEMDTKRFNRLVLQLLEQ